MRIKLDEPDLELASFASADELYKDIHAVQSATVADLLIAYLNALSVEFVFGIPGGAIEPLYDALARSERVGGVRSIVARHEAGAAFMADGYATTSNGLGVCCATTGPGATNLITGVASAYANNVPLLVITAQTQLCSFGRGAFQESSCTGVNTVALFEHCCRYSTLVSHVDQFERKLVTALMSAFGDRRGPVHLSIPADVMRSLAGVNKPRYDIEVLLERPNLVDHNAVDRCCDILKKSKKTVIVIGDVATNVSDDAIRLAGTLDADIVTLPNAKGLISPFNPRYKGVIGFAGHADAQALLGDLQTETIVCIGTKFGEWGSNGWDTHALLNRRMIHIDDQAEHFTFTPMAQLHVHGNLSTVIKQLLTDLKGHCPVNPPLPSSAKKAFALQDEAAFVSASAPIKPQRLMRELAHLFPPHTRYVADTGASLAWAVHYLHPFDRRISGLRPSHGSLFRGCIEFSSMGWAIGHVIGDALADPDRPHVCITGDGSLLMSGQEITVAVQHQLPVIFIVLNDSSLGMVNHGQRLSQAEQIGTQLPAVNFASMAEAMGVNGVVANTPEALGAIDVDHLLHLDRPTLIDVHIDREEVPPIQLRVATLKGNSSE